jgi:hypothetical protein
LHCACWIISALSAKGRGGLQASLGLLKDFIPRDQQAQQQRKWRFLAGQGTGSSSKMASDRHDDDMADVDIEYGQQETTFRNDSHVDSTSFDAHGVQIEKPREASGAAASDARQDRGLLADQDVQRAIWTNRARWFTGLSMIVDFSTGLLALIVGGIIHSAALTGYGLEAFVDMAASCMVLWRFWDSAETEAGMRANQDREERANVVIAFIFVAIAIITSGDAIEHLVEHKSPENGFLIIIFAVITMLLLGAIGATKLWINKHVGSKALEQDAMASFATAAISVGLLVSASAYTASDNIWWLDAVWAIAVTWALAIYSLPILIKKRWWHKSFWKSWATEA